MQLKHDFDGKIEQKFKHFSHSFSSQEKRIDKIANSIHSAVDQKFIKDCELKQQITTNLDERMEGFDKDMRNKLSDFHELISKKLVNLKNEVNEISQETKRNCQSMIEGCEVSNSNENFNTKIEKLIKKTITEKLSDFRSKLQSDINEDIDSIRIQVNNISLKCDKEIAKFLNRQEAKELVESSLNDCLKKLMVLKPI